MGMLPSRLCRTVHCVDLHNMSGGLIPPLLSSQHLNHTALTHIRDPLSFTQIVYSPYQRIEKKPLSDKLLHSSVVLNGGLPDELSSRSFRMVATCFNMSCTTCKVYVLKGASQKFYMDTICF